MNANNATSNDTQGETLADMPNSFSLENRVRCFNHTLQLSAKTLLHPFNVGLGKTTDDGNNNDADNLLDVDDNGLDEDDEDDEDDDNDDDDGLPIVPDDDDIDDGVDELDALDADEREEIIADTAAVREMVSKVCNASHRLVTFNGYIHDSFAASHSPLYDRQPLPFLRGDAIAKNSN